MYHVVRLFSICIIRCACSYDSVLLLHDSLHTTLDTGLSLRHSSLLVFWLVSKYYLLHHNHTVSISCSPCRLEIVVDPWIRGLWIALRIELGLPELAPCLSPGDTAAAGATAPESSSCLLATGEVNGDAAEAVAALDTLNITNGEADTPTASCGDDIPSLAGTSPSLEKSSLQAPASSAAESSSQGSNGEGHEKSFRERLRCPSPALQGVCKYMYACSFHLCNCLRNVIWTVCSSRVVVDSTVFRSLGSRYYISALLFSTHLLPHGGS